MVYIPTANTVNPRQRNRYRVDIEGLQIASVYSVRLPTVDVIEKQYRGGGNLTSTKWPVGVEYGDLELRKVMPADGADSWAWEWLVTVVDDDNYRLGVPEEYKRDIEVHDLNWLRQPIHTWYLAGCWIKALEYDPQGAEDLRKKIQTVIIACDWTKEIEGGGGLGFLGL